MDYNPGIINIDKGERIYSISSDKDTHFTDEIALNAIEYEDISGLNNNKITIRGINIQAKQAFLFTLWLWTSASHANADLDLDTFREYVNLDIATSGKQIAGSGQWYLQSTGLSILYEDKDEAYTLHLGLMVSSGGPKLAGAAGEVQIDISYSPRL